MRSVRTALLATLVLTTVVALTAPAILAGDPDKKEDAPGESGEKKKEVETGEVLSFTNEDLERRFGPPAARPAPAAGDSAGAAAEPDDKNGTRKADDKGDDKDDSKDEPVPDHEMDALEWMNKRKADEAERKKALAEAQEEVLDAEARVKQLQDRLLRIKNPLLARPQASMTDEEKTEWQGENGSARVAMTERQLEEAKTALEEARAELARLQ
jgi:hypothetical protein